MTNVFTAIVSRKAKRSLLSCVALIILRFVEIYYHYEYLILSKYNNICYWYCNSYYCMVIHYTKWQHKCMLSKAVHINNWNDLEKNEIVLCILHL